MRKIFLFSEIYYSEKKVIISIFLLSCAVSVIFLIFFKNIGPAGHRPPGTDYLNCYAPMAENILQGKGIIIDKEYIRCTVGYPVILIPIFYIANIMGLDKVSLVIFFNVIFSAFSSVILFFIGRNIFNKKIGLVTSLLWITYPFNQWLIKNPNTEVPFMVLFFLGILCYINFIKENKRYALFLAGIFLGLASLVRPISILVNLVLAILLFILCKNLPIKKKMLFFLLMIFGNMAVIIPWELYIFSRTNSLVPVSTVGAEGIRVGFSFGAAPGEGGDQLRVPKDVMDFMKRIRSAEVFDHGSYGEVFDLLKREVIRSPMAFIKIMLLKVFRSWYATSEMWMENRILLVQLPYLVLGFFGMIAGMRFYKDKIPYLIVLLIIIVYFWFITTITLSIMRYMIPVMALVLIFATIAIDKLLLKNLVKNES